MPLLDHPSIAHLADSAPAPGRRRALLGVVGGALVLPLWFARRAAASDVDAQHFIAEAARMRAEAVAAGDQPYGAVLVRAGAIIGYGPSRVVTTRNADAHAERVALWDAQVRAGSKDMSGSVLYSTSRPCAACQAALAAAGVARMFHGPAALDAGPPRAL
jgi:tRNA(Arg) A34 adenosine deaminase TadA